MEELEANYKKEKAMRKRRRRKSRDIISALLLVVMFIVIVVLSIAIVSLKRTNKQREEYYKQMVVLTPEEYEADLLESQMVGEAKGAKEFRDDIKSQCESGNNSMISLLRKWYPEYIVYATKKGYVFDEILASIPKHNLETTGIVRAENGDLEYYSQGEKISKKGIDVSKYQGEIDWKKVKASGVDYAIVRVGIRGYGSGKLVLDETLEDNLEGCRKANLPMGVYFVTQATSNEEAKEEAELVLEAIKGYRMEYPVCIDVEEVDDTEARTANLTKAERSEYVITFLETIKAAGYDVMIYGNIKTFCGMLDIESVVDYPRWFAYYDDEMYFPYDIDMWQYSEKGTVDGIKEKVDLNITLK